MNRVSQRSVSQFNISKQILTDRTQSHYHTYRNQSTQFLKSAPHKNNSQIFTQNQKTLNQPNVIDRKKSISSFYFREYPKSKQINSLTSKSYLKKPNQNSLIRKRCQTTFDYTTNKIQKLPQPSQQDCIIKIEPQKFQLNKNHYFCINHPQKKAYFEEQNSSKCFCHQCSIENVKKNKRLVELTPQIKEVKHLISKKIAQSLSYAEQLCFFIKKTVEKNIQQLDSTYKELKKLLNQRNCQRQTLQQSFEFELKQIDWTFIKKMSDIEQNIVNNSFNFLVLKAKKYSIINDIKFEAQKSINTQKSESQIFQCSPIQQKLDINKLSQKKQIKQINLPLPSKNLVKQIQKALNYHSRNTKLKVKKVNLNLQPIKETQNQNKQNFEPNILKSQISFKREESNTKNYSF